MTTSIKKKSPPRRAPGGRRAPREGGAAALKKQIARLKAELAAVDQSQAVIRFAPDGTILDANANFLDVMGYRREEVVGRHHRMFVTPEYAAGGEYADMWRRLDRGEFVRGTLRRVAKGGRAVWIEASYNPILGDDGEPAEIVKIASDVTAQTLRSADHESQLEALGRAQAVIEFDLDGHILHANDNFLSVLGYRLDEIRGRHHRMFVDPAYAGSPEYAEFWASLNRGEHASAEFKRFAKDGREVWIQATYNPILDADGRPTKVVKFATDVTAAKVRAADVEGQMAAIHRAQAVIEFDLDGTIRTANENFLAATGYTLAEVQGQHHSMFVDDAYRRSDEYRDFWARLRAGAYEAGEFRRLGKGGKEIWIQASYNPIFDAAGRPVKVVKYATDITARKRAIAETARVAGALAQGDLVPRMSGAFEGEFVALRDTLNGSLDNLSGMVTQIREAAATISSGAAEINQGNSDLSARTQEQAAALEETAATVQRMTDAVGRNAENAAEASRLAREAAQLAERGGAVVGSAVDAMGKITGSSRQIADIISVIDEIAFQTNLLALNAAVEAARAGEQGRGFAVVASEVRNLAQRSAKAAKEIKGLIRDSLASVDEGSGLVDASGETLQQIVGGVKKVSDIIAEIAAASAEQAEGIEQVNGAVAQLDSATQQNAALVEQAAAASASMDQQAQQMTNLVAAFRIDDGAGGPVPQAVLTSRTARGGSPGRHLRAVPASARVAPSSVD